MQSYEAIIEFTKDWRQVQHGAIKRGERLRIDYDIRRLSHCFTTWHGAGIGETIAHVRFHPRGDIISSGVAGRVNEPENPLAISRSESIPLEIIVPDDAAQAEIWFHNFYETSERCDAWDSRFGVNYWFDINGAPPRVPKQSVIYRSGAVTSPGMVNVLEQSAAKINTFPSLPEGGSREGTDLQTVLTVTAWVEETHFGANAWMDVHVFDGADELIHSQTLTLLFEGLGRSPRYIFSGLVYQGSTATPGSAQPRPEARKIQYRLYYKVNRRVYTDGILHQLQLPEDAIS